MLRQELKLIKKQEDDEEIVQQCVYETDPQAISLINDVQNFRLGQTIDNVRRSAMILSGISAPIQDSAI
jgi:hypothetical protein